MLIAHLSDLHLRNVDEVSWLDRQLTRIVAQDPVHLAVTGDLLDRWDPVLLECALDAFGAHGLLDGERLTLLHGNHDLASSGGQPRQNADLWRLALRFWDPPPLMRRRRRQFYSSIGARAGRIAEPAPWVKTVANGLRLATIDTVPFPWRPILLETGALVVRHAIGCARRHEIDWLARQRGDAPLILLVHHYPLQTAPFTWTPNRDVGRGLATLANVVREVRVPMAIEEPERERFWLAARDAGVRLVLCGHVHRARLEWHNGIAVGLNGQSGAEWAGRTIAYYEVGERTISMRSEHVG